MKTMIVAACVSMLVAWGCCSSGGSAPASPDAYTHVVAIETPYYTTSPAQGRPPDGQLKVGTKVRVTQDAGSYVRVSVENGVEAFIAADALKSR